MDYPFLKLQTLPCIDNKNQQTVIELVMRNAISFLPCFAYTLVPIGVFSTEHLLYVFWQSTSDVVMRGLKALPSPCPMSFDVEHGKGRNFSCACWRNNKVRVLIISREFPPYFITCCFVHWCK